MGHLNVLLEIRNKLEVNHMGLTLTKYLNTIELKGNGSKVVVKLLVEQLFFSESFKKR